jgi:chromosomal replication initiation ATPase DnaA
LSRNFLRSSSIPGSRVCSWWTAILGRAIFSLIAPNRFVMQWVRERYLGQIESLGREFFSTPVNITLSVSDAAQNASGLCGSPRRAALAKVPAPTHKPAAIH